MENEYFLNNIKLDEVLAEEKLNQYINAYKNGNRKYKDIIIRSNIKLVIHRVLKKFNNTPYDKDELISIGIIGLIKSLEGFDMAKNTKYITYACRCIDNEILMFLRKSKRHLNVESIYTENPMCDSNLTIEDTLYDKNENIEEKYENKESIIEIQKIINKLSEKERKIISMYFGINNKIHTQKEIFEIFNVSQPTISKMKNKILKKIKREFLSYKNDIKYI